MSQKPESAFVPADGHIYQSNRTSPDETTLTKREYFAGQAVAGMADGGLTPEYVARHAVQYADALIAELERTNA